MKPKLVATESGWITSSRLQPEEWAKVRHLFVKGMIFDEGEPVREAYITNSRSKVLSLLGIPDEIAEKESAETKLATAEDRAELESIFADQLCDSNLSAEFYAGGVIKVGRYHTAYAYFRQSPTALKCVGVVIRPSR